MKRFIGMLSVGIIASLGHHSSASGIGIAAKELRCEYSVNPVGVDSPRPRFSWVLESTRRGQMQSAYQVLVAGSEDKLKSNFGDKWDSGKVVSRESINVAYEGKALSTGEKCYWKIRVWDGNDKPGDYSAPRTFEMGLLKEKDWQGEWIGMAGPGAPLRYIAGKSGQAVGLDGKSECVKIEHYAQLKPKAQITISAWVKPNEDLGDGWREIYRKEDGDARQLLALGKTGEIWGVWFGRGINGSYTEHGASTSPEKLRDGKWHFIAATYDGSAKRILVDGKEIGSAEANGQIDRDGSSAAYIGSRNGAQPRPRLWAWPLSRRIIANVG